MKETWWLIDAQDKTLGRLASHIAKRLRGKFRADFAPNRSSKDYIIVVNSDKLKVTGKKADDKMYYRHSGYMGHLKESTYSEMQDRHPGRVLELAVKGMLPRGPLGRELFTQLKVYSGEQHPHAAQQPQALSVEEA